MKQKGFAQYLVIIILLAGIGVTVYLTQFTQIFKPKANTGTTPTKISDSAFEPDYNPFGDPWDWKKSPARDQQGNPYIPVSLGVPSYRALGPKKDTNEIPQREIEYLAKSNSPILYMDSAVLQLERNPVDNDLGKYIKLKSLIGSLKNKGIEVIGYTVAHEGVPWANWIAELANERTRADEFGLVRPDYYESFFIHKKNTQSTRENRVGTIMNITNPEYRAFIIPKMVEAMRELQLGGVLMDGVFADAINLMSVQDQIPEEIKAAWPGAAAQFAQELKTAMGNDLLLFANVGREDVNYVKNDLFQPGRLDGIMLEDPIGRSEQYPGSGNEAPPFVPGSRSYDNTSAMLKLAKEKDKYVMVVVNTNVNCPPYPQELTDKLNLPPTAANNAVIQEAQTRSRTWCYEKTAETTERRYASFFLAAYLQQFQSPKQILIYYTPTNAFYQFFSETFFREWDLNIGLPIAQVEPVAGAPGIFVRKFERAYVYLNTTYSNYSITSGSGIYDTVDGTEINRGIVPARSGRIFVTNALLQEFNQQPPALPSPSSSPSPSISPSPSASPSQSPSPSPSLSPSPSPSPSPSGSQSPSPTHSQKPGDTDGDGDVDIRDFNAVVRDFGKTNDPNARGDLDGDDDVDIRDFNILVLNFNR